MFFHPWFVSFHRQAEKSEKSKKVWTFNWKQSKLNLGCYEARRLLIKIPLEIQSDLFMWLFCFKALQFVFSDRSWTFHSLTIQFADSSSAIQHNFSFFLVKPNLNFKLNNQFAIASTLFASNTAKPIFKSTLINDSISITICRWTIRMHFAFESVFSLVNHRLCPIFGWSGFVRWK